MSEEAYVELRKKFVRSFLELMVLRMLADEHLWGYKLMTMMKEIHDIKIGPAVVYPLLGSLEADGLVECNEIYEGKRRRKVYKVTSEGVERLRCFGRILQEFSGAPPEPY